MEVGDENTWFTECLQTIEVHDKSKLKPDEVTIEAKIIEK